MTSRTQCTPAGDPLQVVIVRGRQRLLDRFTPGYCQIVYDNSTGTFDAFDTSIAVGDRVRVLFDGTTLEDVFDGQLVQIRNDYPLGERPTTTIYAHDPTALIYRWTLPAAYAPVTRSQELSGTRMDAIKLALGLVGVSTTWNNDSGSETLAAKTYNAGATAFEIIHDIVDTERGKFYAQRNGNIRFKQRNPAGPTTTSATFSDTGSNLPFHRIEVRNADDVYANVVSLLNSGSSTYQTANDDTSAATYGPAAYQRTNLLYTSDARALDMANYLLDAWSTPEPRIASIGIDIHLLSDADATTVAKLDIDDQIRIIWTPPGATAIDKTVTIEGVRHSIGLDTHRIDLDLIEPQWEPFTLDSAALGVLDTNKLGI